MGVRITSAEKCVAIFDSVSGWAFGPTFANEEEAEAFLTFAEENDKRDLRTLTNNEVATLCSAFVDAREPATF